MSNKHMVIGLVAGIGIATAGGVAAYQFLGRHSDEPAVEQTSPSVGTAHARARPSTVQPSPHATPAVAAPVATATAAPAENCWDEEVTVQRDKTDAACDRGHGDRRRGRRGGRQRRRSPRNHDRGRRGGRCVHRP